MYDIQEQMESRLKNDFTYHAPKDGQAERYEMIREAGRVFATLICSMTPTSREQSLALTQVDQAVMWANAAIARNE